MAEAKYNLVVDSETDPPPGGRIWREHPPWDAWSPAEVADRLAHVKWPWCVAAGWAIDLFAGQQTRPHGDIEIAVPAAGFGDIRAAFGELEFEVAGWGRLWPVDSPAFSLSHQTWGRDPRSRVYRIDVFRESHDDDTWICRRDESIRVPYDRIVRRTADGIPYLAPEAVLLFKAKHRRAKDEADFAATVPRMTQASRDTLAGWLARVHPGHPWLGVLAGHQDRPAGLR